MTLAKINTRVINNNGRGKLAAGHITHALCRDLATGDHSYRELGRRYGVAASSIHEFGQRHEARISAIRASLDAQFAGLWIADKANRLAEIQAIAESVITDPEVSRVRLAALKLAAEELGQLAARVQNTVQVSTTQVSYILGVTEDEDV